MPSKIEKQIKILTSKRENLFRRMQTLYDLIPNLSSTDKLKEFKTRYSNIHETFKQFEDLQDEIYSLSLELDETLDVNPTIQSTKSFEDLYYKVTAAYTEYVNEDSSKSTIGNQSSKREIRPRLPELELPKFDGNSISWSSFHDNFKSLIHDNDALTKIEKFHYLISSLSGPPLAVVRALPITEDNYVIAWNSLVQKYENKRVLASNLLNNILNYNPTVTESGKSLTYFLSNLYEPVMALKALKIPDLSDYILLHLALCKLPITTRKRFETNFIHKEFPSFQDLITFIQNQTHVLDISEGSNILNRNHVHKGNTNKFQTTPAKLSAGNHTNLKQVYVSSENKPSMKHSDINKVFTCPSCNKNHTIYKCPSFLSSTPTERELVVKKLRLCFNCLKKGHGTRQCPSKTNCLKCNGRHHSYLHLNRNTETIPALNCEDVKHHSTNPAKEQSNSVASTACNLQTGRSLSYSVILGTAVIHVLDCNNRYQPVRALIDSAAQQSFITSKCARRLGLSCRNTSLSISGLGQSSVFNVEGVVSCLLKPRNTETPVFSTEALVIPRITLDMPTVRIPDSIINRFKDVFLADPNYFHQSPIELLLGADIYPEIYDGQKIYADGKNGPVALQSVFGWVITGRLPNNYRSPAPVSSLVCSTENLNSTLKKFWELENVPERPQLSDEDTYCESLFQQQHYRTKDGRYVVPLLLKSPSPEFGDSYTLAVNRLHSINRRLARHPNLKNDYTKFMEEFIQLGHMEPVSSTSDFKINYYIPHHCVCKDSSSTRVRVVFDASCRPHSGKSLNDELYAGPKLQIDIMKILLRFRLHPIVFCADICKMYRQILVRPEECKYQHILWNSTDNEKMVEFEIKRVTYGLASSPYLALRVIKQLINDEGTDFPLAASALSTDIFVDDVLTGASSLIDALKLQRQIIELLKRGGFQLRKWMSNHPDLLKSIPACDQETAITFEKDNNVFVKLLGVQWSATSDIFSYRVSSIPVNCTKRSLLSFIAKIYDPVGWLSPVVFTAKCFLQRLWLLGLDWDMPIPSNIEEEWKKYVTHISSLSDVQIERYVLIDNFTQCQLFGFSDASEKGYGAAVYLKVVDSEGRTKVSLLTAKSRVAPLKTISVPRLELCGALLLTKLMQFVIQALQDILIVSETYYFTDSTVVLAWLQILPCKLKTFVANRVTEILECTKPEQWHHITSHENPADLASRGCDPPDIIQHHLWWNGPTWLKLPKENWNSATFSISPSTSVPEVKSVALPSTILPSDFLEHYLCSRTSSYIKLVRLVAWCLRFIWCLKNKTRQTGPITTQEYKQAENCCIYYIQRYHFHEEIQTLQTSPQTSNLTKSFRSLQPFIDSAGLLRVGGRLKHAHISSDYRHPILLPKRSNFTNLVITYYHQNYLHAGPRLLQSLIQRRYWIISVRSQIRSIISRCLTCIKQNPTVNPPLMGQLPPARVNSSMPFRSVGVDFCGHFNIKESRRRKAKVYKAYVCVFVCLATKAIHLELVSDLSTSAFIAALDRFTSRRGLCNEIYSDNGTNFIGAHRYLKDIHKFLSNSSIQHELQDYLSKTRITWHFSPPTGSHFGGLWEAGVRSTKYHLKRVIGTQILTFEEFTTLLCKIEAILNSRPLCQLSPDPAEYDVLTPGHFLTGQPLISLPEEDLTDSKPGRLQRWDLIKQMTQHFWRRWCQEYLHTLQQRNKWTVDTPNLKVDTLVIIKDSHMPPQKWRIGRIVDLHPGSDGRVRVVTVRTTQGSFRRPVVKLVPLPDN